MTFTQAIQAGLINAIVSHCQISREEAAKHLAVAKKTAKMMGLPLADTLKHIGLVA